MHGKTASDLLANAKFRIENLTPAPAESGAGAGNEPAVVLGRSC